MDENHSTEMGTSQRRAAIFIGREDDSQSHLPTSKTWARAVTSLQGERGGYYVVSRLDQAGIRALQKVSDLQSPKKHQGMSETGPYNPATLSSSPRDPEIFLLQFPHL